MARIILASTSAARIGMLTNAGIAFEAMPPRVDERMIEEPLIKAGKSPGEVALALAEAKALGIGKADRAAFVIGADQTLSMGERRFSKPANMDEARRQLLALSATTHELHTAVAGVHGGTVAWRHIDTARMTMRGLRFDEIDAYLAKVGEAALTSVGAYQVEGPGIQLFERIEGDYFTILGLPLIAVLGWLRQAGALE